MTQKSFLTIAGGKKEQQASSSASTTHFLVVCHSTEDLRPFVTTVLNLAVCCGLMEAARFFCTQVSRVLEVTLFKILWNKSIILFVGALFFTSVWHGPIKRMFFNVNDFSLFYFNSVLRKKNAYCFSLMIEIAACYFSVNQLNYYKLIAVAGCS